MLNNISIYQFADILSESPTLRAIVAETVMNAEPDRIVQQVKAIIHRHYNNKIAAIKAVRDLGPASVFHNKFNLDMPSTSTTGNLGLADAKNLVEYIAHELGVTWS